MKIVFDTNVLISGFLTPTGPSQHVLGIALKRHVVVLSGYILKEFERKLSGKLQMPREVIKQAIDYLRAKAAVFETVPNPKIKFSDIKDVPILSLIRLSKAHYCITGDKKLLDLKRFDAAIFLTPREAMELFDNIQ